MEGSKFYNLVVLFFFLFSFLLLLYQVLRLIGVWEGWISTTIFQGEETIAKDRSKYKVSTEASTKRRPREVMTMLSRLLWLFLVLILSKLGLPQLTIVLVSTIVVELERERDSSHLIRLGGIGLECRFSSHFVR